MGVTLHAQIERRTKADNNWIVWRMLSRWDFGKDYLASTAVNDKARSGWPGHPDFTQEELDIFDQGLCWLGLEDLPIVKNATSAWQSFEASLVPLVTDDSDDDIRILFWHL